MGETDIKTVLHNQQEMEGRIDLIQQRTDRNERDIDQLTRNTKFEVVTIAGQPADLIYTSGGTDYVLDAAGGSMAAQGYPASFLFALRMIAGGGSLTFSTNPATIRYDRRVNGEGGALGISGNAAALRRLLLLMAGAGSYSINGQAVQFFLNLPRDPLASGSKIRPALPRDSAMNGSLPEASRMRDKAPAASSMNGTLRARSKMKTTLTH